MSSSIELETIEKPSLPLQATLQIARAITIKRRSLFFLTFVFFVMPYSMQDLSSLTRDPVWAMAVNALSPNHWTTREFPKIVFIYLFF